MQSTCCKLSQIIQLFTTDTYVVQETTQSRQSFDDAHPSGHGPPLGPWCGAGKGDGKTLLL